MRNDRWSGIVVVGLAVALAGCSNGIRESIGLTKQAPDEFQVIAHAPLELPPDFNLRPPEPGAPRPQEGTAQDQAETAVLGAPISGTPTEQSTGEMALLQNAGATGIDPNIRAEIDQETAQQIERDKSLIDRLVFWNEPEPYGTIVDPVAESQRLKENAALGKPVTEGETPIIKRKKRALLEGIF
ncbi:MAG: DUF3035 domain-containing protein [Dongiaceae bacterium]